ncbi:VOC family protein [Streptacidiphilus sp. N1-12]|uniref:VOC family protein n=2 Tax=Streptacidiphilus alkalitolerans TaxID=3342712 RepID=A0ABV6XBH8_9ACTN
MAPVIALACIVIDCQDPARVAAFYRDASGGEITHSDDDSAWVTMSGTTWVFRRVDGYRPPTWPSSKVPLRVHMDFFVDDLEAAEKQLQAYGATTPEHQPKDRALGLLVMLDPAGHPFCLATRS